MNVSPMIPAMRMSRPPTTEPTIVPAEIVVQLLFAHAVVVGTSLTPLAVAVNLVPVAVVLPISVCELEKNVMDIE
jgi:hypothetical protein